VQRPHQAVAARVCRGPVRVEGAPEGVGGYALPRLAWEMRPPSQTLVPTCSMALTRPSTIGVSSGLSDGNASTAPLASRRAAAVENSNMRVLLIPIISSSARASLNPARRILVVIAFPSTHLEFFVLADHLTDSKGDASPRPLVYGPPCGDVHKEVPARAALGISKHNKSPVWGRMGNQNQRGLAPRGLYRTVAKPPTGSKKAGAMRNFGECDSGEVRRIHLPGTRVHRSCYVMGGNLKGLGSPVLVSPGRAPGKVRLPCDGEKRGGW
jgi:hypothetical protein